MGAYKLCLYRTQDDYQYGRPCDRLESTDLKKLALDGKSICKSDRLVAGIITDGKNNGMNSVVCAIHNRGTYVKVEFAVDSNRSQFNVCTYTNTFRKYFDPKFEYGIFEVNGKNALCIIKDGKGPSVIFDDIDVSLDGELKRAVYGILTEAMNKVKKPISSLTFYCDGGHLFGSWSPSVEKGSVDVHYNTYPIG